MRKTVYVANGCCSHKERKRKFPSSFITSVGELAKSKATSSGVLRVQLPKNFIEFSHSL